MSCHRPVVVGVSLTTIDPFWSQLLIAGFSRLSVNVISRFMIGVNEQRLSHWIMLDDRMKKNRWVERNYHWIFIWCCSTLQKLFTKLLKFHWDAQYISYFSFSVIEISGWLAQIFTTNIFGRFECLHSIFFTKSTLITSLNTFTAVLTPQNANFYEKFHFFRFWRNPPFSIGAKKNFWRKFYFLFSGAQRWKRNWSITY